MAAQEAPECNWLEPAAAGKLCAKAHFASRTITGKCLRGCENALVAIQHGKFPQPSFAGCLVLPTVGSAVPAGIYTDAMYEAGKPAGMAFVAQLASRAYPKVGYLAVPDSVMQVLLPRKTRSTRPNVSPLALAARACGDALRCDIVHFVDNQGTRGYR